MTDYFPSDLTVNEVNKKKHECFLLAYKSILSSDVFMFSQQQKAALFSLTRLFDCIHKDFFCQTEIIICYFPKLIHGRERKEEKTQYLETQTKEKSLT